MHIGSNEHKPSTYHPSEEPILSALQKHSHVVLAADLSTQRCIRTKQASSPISTKPVAA